MKDATGKFDRIGLHVIDRHILEPVVQIGLKPGKGGTVDSKCVLYAGEKDGVVNSVKSRRSRSVRNETFPESKARSESFTM